MADLRTACFFCNNAIKEKKTLEHIIPNSLLGRLRIKEETITGRKETQYSRIKVPAHSSCNSEFGSAYESRVLNLLEDLDSLYETIKSEELGLPMMYGPDESATAIITTWLSKNYYGLFYYDLISTQDEEWQEVCSSVVAGRNFEYVRASYKNGHGFQLPSSLYVFKTKNANTDLVTLVDPSSILLKIGSLTFILCICDGYLTKSYLNGEVLGRLRDWVRQEDERDIRSPSHKIALGEIAALRSCIPKTPRFILSDDQVINMSLSTMVANPDECYRVDEQALSNARAQILREFNIELG
ncbi:hypothetical protein QC589_08070 [Halomonas elongata]|uniref:hypothetical protein n=1 Tax=Halomonas elongata TaxID=2746 RepID=UPI0033467BD2